MVGTSTAVRKGLEIFYVPCGLDQERVFQVIFSVHEDGSLTFRSDLTETQCEAITAHITHNNQHMIVKRGNSLSVMTDEEQALYDAVIDALKDEEQKHYEAITGLVLSEYTWTHDWWKRFVSWFEEMGWEEYPQDRLYEVQVTENSEGYFSYCLPSIHTWHIVREKPTGELDILQAYCSLAKNDRSTESEARDE